MTNNQNKYSGTTDNYSNLVFFPPLCKVYYLYSGISFIHKMHIYNPNDSIAH